MRNLNRKMLETFKLTCDESRIYEIYVNENGHRRCFTAPWWIYRVITVSTLDAIRDVSVSNNHFIF